jgi:hypothetical protein
MPAHPVDEHDSNAAHVVDPLGHLQRVDRAGD